MIKQGSTINVENIISARAMRYESVKTVVGNQVKKKRNEYGGSFYQGTYPEQFWPKGLTVENPFYVNQSQLEHTEEFEETVKQLQVERENAGGFVLGIK